METPAGVTEVDARPSDALNMALITGARIRVDNELFDEPSVVEDQTWQNYPREGARDLAVEIHKYDNEQLAAAMRLAEGGRPPPA